MSTLQLLENTEQLSFFEEDEDSEDIYNSEDKLLEEISGILVAGTDWTTATLLDQLVRENIQLNPRFQRRDAWNIKRKSRFIESIMLGFPIPQIVLASNEKERGKFIVLDGKQRLLTILQFYGKSETPNNKFKLRGLEFRKDLNNCSYQDLQSNTEYVSVLDPLDNQTIRTTLIRNWHTENFLYKIFLRLNVENTPLSPQELRQALHPGAFVDFLDDQSVKSKALKKILKSPNPDFRMRDNELLMRYMGFHYFLPRYRGTLKAFLDKTCEDLNVEWQTRSEDIENASIQFEYAIETTIKIFGEKNFSRMWINSSSSYRSQFNRAILDVMVFYFSDEIIREVSKTKQTLIESAFKELCSSDNKFKESVEGNTKNILETYNRLSLWGTSLLNVLDIEFNIPELIDGRIVFHSFR
jgi:Protein of unknown function DUF262